MKTELGLQDNEPRVVIGVKGVKSKDFRKRFANAKAMEKWLASDAAMDVTIFVIERVS